MHTMTLRRQHVLTGAIALLLLFGAVTVGVKGAFGAFDGGYELVGTFDAAGQGLLSGSDVKVRGVNIGQVRSIELVDGHALVKLRIKDGERLPTDASAVIRPKTLFGEKFVDVDPGPAEATGPFLADGDEIVNTLGGFELEQVLTDLYPLLKAIDPAELMTVLGELADGGRGMGESVNRSIVNGEQLTTLFADNADLTREFLADMAALSDQLGSSADDLVALADAANVALPTLNDHEDDLVSLLQQTGRLSNDVADLLENNKAFVQASLVDGSRTLQVLYDQRDQVVPLVIGLRQYVQTLAISIRIDLGDGTLMAAVKGVLGGDLCGVLPCPGVGAASSAPAPDLPAVPPSPVPDVLQLPGLPPLPLGPLLGGGSTSTSGGGLFGLLNRTWIG
jgi:phospholipid/cholesterol/gamma-HCH transport system substrate-binding protein